MIRPIYSTSMDVELSVEEIESEPIVNVFPNPTTDEITIALENKEYSGVEVYSIQGTLMFDTKESKISLVNFPGGVYFLRIKGVDNVYKIIKY
jgi:hypothetical protein